MTQKTSTPSFEKWMLKHWQSPSEKSPKVQKGQRFFQQRRHQLLKKHPNTLFVIPSGHESVRSHDTFYRFRAASDFYYLSGCTEADAVLTLQHQDPQYILWIDSDEGRDNLKFFEDRHRGSFWVGPRQSAKVYQKIFNTDAVRPLAELEGFLKKACRQATKVASTPQISSKTDDFLIKHVAAKKKSDCRSLLSHMRLCKDSFEIEQLRLACRITEKAFEDVVRLLKDAKNKSLTERHIEGIFQLRARLEGNDVGYGTIAACGSHACVLHWQHNHGPVKPGELLLLDAGVESQHLYTADITRTLPINGRFDRYQQEVYEYVLEAQKVAIAATQPDHDFLEPHRQATKVLAQGLIDMKILKMSLSDALDPQSSFYKRYTLHGTSHMLGIDVHDCGYADAIHYRQGQLKKGMILTIEPGLYFQEDDLTVPKHYRGIGVRIEDDLLVNQKGHEILSNLPREVRDVERWMKQLFA